MDKNEETTPNNNAHNVTANGPAHTAPQETTIASPVLITETLPKSHAKAKTVKPLTVTQAVFVSAIVGFGGGWLSSYANSQQSASSIDEKKIVMSTEGDVISDVASTVGKSVVSINVTQQTTTTNYFGNTRSSESQAAGTGIIISTDGLVLTNRHVVPEGTSKVSIVMSDGTTFDDVEVVGRTSSSDTLDIAFLQINDTKGITLTAAKIGDSSKVKVGERVIAIGNALGQFQNTVTTGILSGYGRSIIAGGENGSTENLENLFQTDAAINQGNSGGPLVNLSGQVIGVNVAIADDAQSVGFAIPINDVKGLIESVKTTGRLERPYIGVVYLPITADVASEYSLPVKKGAYIAPRNVVGQEPIITGGPAERAGLKPGDIITEVNGIAIDQGASLTSLLGRSKVGDTVTLTVVRGDKTEKIRITLAAAPQN